MTRGAAFDVQAVCSGFVYAHVGRRQFHQGGAGEDRSADRRGDHVAAAGLERPHHLRAVRRRRGRGGAAGGRGPRRHHRSRRAQHRSFIPTAGCTIFFMSTADPSTDADHRQAAHAGQGSVQARGDQHRRLRSRAAARAAGVSVSDIDWIVPHQANQRILDGTAHRLGVSAGAGDFHHCANTAIRRPPRCRWRSPWAVADGRIKRGDLVLLEAMGGGFTWGAALVRW